MKRITWIIKTITIIFILINNVNIKTYAATDFDGTEKGTESGTMSGNQSGSMTGTNKGTSYTYYEAYNIIANNVSIDTTNYTNIKTNIILYQSTIGSNYYYRGSKNLIQDKRSGTYYYSDYTPSSTARGNLYTTEPILIPMTTDGTLFTRVQTINNDQTFTGSTSGNYNGNFTGTFTGTFEGDIIIPQQDIIEYPPRYPVTTGVTYSEIYDTDLYCTSYSAKTEGLTIKEGYSYGTFDVSYTFNFNKVLPSTQFAVYFPCVLVGGYTTTGKPNGSEFLDSSIYAYNVTENSRQINIEAFNKDKEGQPILYMQGRSINNNYFTITVSYFSEINIPAFDYTRTPNRPQNQLWYTSDLTSINENIKKQNNSMESAGGKNNELNSQNNLLQSEMQQYMKDTDTTKQYGNITDDLFVLNTGIFTQVASTMTLWSAIVTGLFTAFGDLAIPMNMFLVFVLMSCIIGIVRYIAGNGG